MEEKVGVFCSPPPPSLHTGSTSTLPGLRRAPLQPSPTSPDPGSRGNPAAPGPALTCAAAPGSRSTSASENLPRKHNAVSGRATGPRGRQGRGGRSPWRGRSRYRCHPLLHAGRRRRETSGAAEAPAPHAPSKAAPREGCREPRERPRRPRPFLPRQPAPSSGPGRPGPRPLGWWGFAARSARFGYSLTGGCGCTSED